MNIPCVLVVLISVCFIGFTYSSTLRDRRQIGTECVANTFTKVDCNRCKCSHGFWACTKKQCYEKFKRDILPVSSDLKNTPCAPGDYFKVDCNTCYCNIERTGYLCTQNLCPVILENSTVKIYEETVTPTSPINLSNATNLKFISNSNVTSFINETMIQVSKKNTQVVNETTDEKHLENPELLEAQNDLNLKINATSESVSDTVLKNSENSTNTN